MGRGGWQLKTQNDIRKPMLRGEKETHLQDALMTALRPVWGEATLPRHACCGKAPRGKEHPEQSEGWECQRRRARSTSPVMSASMAAYRKCLGVRLLCSQLLMVVCTLIQSCAFCKLVSLLLHIASMKRSHASQNMRQGIHTPAALCACPSVIQCH